MITLLSRADCLVRHPVLAQSLRAIQAAHDPGLGSPDQVDPDEAAWFAAFRDEIPAAATPPFQEMLILQLPAASLDELAASLPDAMERLLAALGGDAATFVHLSRRARWPTRRRSPSVLADAARRFRELGARGGFNGGIRAGRGSLAGVVAPLFWSTRMDGGYGEVYFALGGAPVVGSLCRYGNLHLEVYGRGAPEPVRKAVAPAGFEVLPHMCEERFGAGGKIEGRRIRV